MQRVAVMVARCALCRIYKYSCSRGENPMPKALTEGDNEVSLDTIEKSLSRGSHNR